MEAFSHLKSPNKNSSNSSASTYVEPETLLEVQVSNPTQVGDHVEYRVDLACNLPQLPPHATVWKRYSQFVQLREQVRLETPQALIPQLPPKSYLQQVDIAKRTEGLDSFLRGVVGHPLVNTKSRALSDFFK